MFSPIARYQLAENTQPRLLLFTKLNLEGKVRVEAGTVEKGIVPECDVVDGVVFPDRLRAVRALDRNIGAWRVFR